MNEDKATRYRRLRRRMGLLTAAGWVALLVGVVLSGATHALAAASREVSHLTGWAVFAQTGVSAAVYAAVLALAGTIVAFPFTWYRDVVLERRFGRLRQGVAAWLHAHWRMTLVRVVVVAIGAVGVYVGLAWQPTWWWLAAGVAFGVTMLLITHLAPLVTIPRLYRLRPITRPGLKERLEILARRLGVPVSAIRVCDLDADPLRPNAALVGMGPTRQVLLSDALLTDYSDDEIEVVLAHELAHYVYGDVWKTWLFETATATLACAAAHWALWQLGPLVGLAGITDVAGLPIVALAAGSTVVMLTPVANAMSRRQERRADAYALAVTKNPDALASGLRRLAQQSLAETQPSPLVEWLFFTHPPLGARLAAARQAAAPRDADARNQA